MIHNDYESYYETILEMSGKPSMEIKRIMQLPIEILKTVINVNPDLMKNIFTTKQNGTVQLYDKIVRITILQPTAEKVWEFWDQKYETRYLQMQKWIY